MQLSRFVSMCMGSNRLFSRRIDAMKTSNFRVVWWKYQHNLFLNKSCLHLTPTLNYIQNITQKGRKFFSFAELKNKMYEKNTRYLCVWQHLSRKLADRTKFKLSTFRWTNSDNLSLLQSALRLWICLTSKDNRLKYFGPEYNVNIA